MAQTCTEKAQHQKRPHDPGGLEKKFPSLVRRYRNKYFPIRLMFQDESRFGLISDARRCWCHAPERPVCPVTISHQAVYAYAVVSIGSGQVDSLILPRVDTGCMQIFLDEIASRYPNEKLVMVLDNAGWHLGNDLKVPKNMRLLSLPPYSPELNPMENIWDELREKSFHNRVFEDLDQMEEHLLSALRKIEASPGITKSISDWSWIVKALD